MVMVLNWYQILFSPNPLSIYFNLINLIRMCKQIWVNSLNNNERPTDGLIKKPFSDLGQTKDGGGCDVTIQRPPLYHNPISCKLM